MNLIQLYKGSVTPGLKDGIPVSIGTGESPIDPGLLNATANQQTEPFELAIRCMDGFETVGEVVILPTGTTYDKWRFAKNEFGAPGSFSTYGEALVLNETIGDTNTIIWCQVRATDNEYAMIDDTVQINIATSIKMREPLEEADMLTFGFLADDNAALSVDVVGTITEDVGGNTIAVEVPIGTDVTALIATFTTSDFATVISSATPQVSGTTANNFTSDVTYTVVAEDGITTKDYVVTVTIAT